MVNYIFSGQNKVMLYNVMCLKKDLTGQLRHIFTIFSKNLPVIHSTVFSPVYKIDRKSYTQPDYKYYFSESG